MAVAISVAIIANSSDVVFNSSGVVFNVSGVVFNVSDAVYDMNGIAFTGSKIRDYRVRWIGRTGGRLWPTNWSVLTDHTVGQSFIYHQQE